MSFELMMSQLGYPFWDGLGFHARSMIGCQECGLDYLSVGEVKERALGNEQRILCEDCFRFVVYDLAEPLPF